MRLRVFISLLAALFALVSSGGVAAAGPPASGSAVFLNDAVPLNNSRPAPGLHTDNHRIVRPQPVRHDRYGTARPVPPATTARMAPGAPDRSAPRCVRPGRMQPSFDDWITSLWNRGGGDITLVDQDDRSRLIHLVDGVRIAC